MRPWRIRSRLPLLLALAVLLAAPSLWVGDAALRAEEEKNKTGANATQTNTHHDHLIQGAFGYVLGEVWEGPATVAEPGLLKVEVPPKVDSKLFDFHSLWLDPESRRIVQISASRAYADPKKAEEANLALMGILTGKYGQPRTEQLRQVFGADGRSVHVLMSQEGDTALLGVVYQDDRATASALTRPRFELKLPDIPGMNGTIETEEDDGL